VNIDLTRREVVPSIMLRAMRTGSFIYALALAAGLCAVLSAQEPATPSVEDPGRANPSGGQDGLALMVDYLPQALFEGEPLTLCLRGENTNDQAAAAEVSFSVIGADGKALREGAENLALAGQGFAPWRKDFELAGVRNLRASLKRDGKEYAALRVRVLHDSDAWPKTEVRGGRLVEAETGDLLTVATRRRLAADNRTWAPIRWASGDEHPLKDAGPAALFLPGAWAKEVDGKLDFEALAPQGGPAPQPLGPYVLRGVAPVLLAAGDVLRALPEAAPERVVVWLPPEDLEAATDARLYQVALECLLTRLEERGVKHAVILAPVKFGTPAPRQEKLLGAVREAAKAHNAYLAGGSEALEESLWRLDPKTPNVYGPRPNVDGRKWIAQKLAVLVE